MISAGIQVEEACGVEFNNLRMKRAHRYLIFKVSDDKSKVEIDQIGQRDATFEQFKEHMPKDRCR